MTRQDGNLAIQVRYNEEDNRLLMAHWRLADLERREHGVMFVVEAKCGCTANLGALLPCERHVNVRDFRVIDATAPVGKWIPLR
jgi:hypothetical protein